MNITRWRMGYTILVLLTLLVWTYHWTKGVLA